VLLVDERDRLLLFRIEDPAASDPVFWLTPGGGLQGRESYAQAARRELREETGLDLPPGPCVWSLRHVFRDAQALEVWERYFVARTATTALRRNGWEPAEAAVITAQRWWTLAEIARSPEVFAPRNLAALLPDVLAGRYPPRPLRIGLGL